jgi:hypothetical protein
MGQVNPIEKLERSELIIASTIHGLPPAQLLQDEAQQARLRSSAPKLFTEG